MKKLLSRQSVVAGVAILAPWVLALAIVTGWVRVPGLGAAEAATQTLSLSPDAPAVRVGETFEMTVELGGATNLGGFEFDLGYDPNVVQVDQVAMGTGLDAADRTVAPLGPLDVDTQTVAFGGYSYGTGAGSSGGTLAHLIMTAVGEGSSTLSLQNAHTANITALATTPVLRNGTVTASAASGGTPHDLALKAGWNLIALPAFPGDISADSVFNPLAQAGTLLAVQSFECTSQNPALSYYPGLGSQNTLNKTYARRGYWVKVSADTTLQITGPDLTNMPIPLCRGWNLIAYTGPAPASLSDALQSIAGKYTAVIGFDQGTIAWYKKLPAGMSSLSELVPGHGYWIYATEASVLRYP